MNVNILDAIMNIVKDPVINVKEYSDSRNRANSMGAALEEYIKDMFAGTITTDNKERMKRFSEVFSYFGNQNNPPDFMIKGGDAVEVKKIESMGSGLALNSSYPKYKIFADSPMITQACKTAEKWEEKDIIYAVGVLPRNNRLRQLTLIYGVDYAAKEEVYTRIKDSISNGVNEIPGIEFAETRELGRVNRVDPLGITYLRIRGMWGIDNPLRVYDYIYKPDPDKEFNFMAIVNLDKYNTFKNKDEFERFIEGRTDIIMESVEIKDPNNPVQLVEAKLITYSL
jgi:hypothetical protein